MQIVSIQPLTASPRLTPREVVRLNPSAHGIDFCFGTLRDVPFTAIELAAVFAVGKPKSALQLLLCVHDQDRPLVVSASNIDFEEFLGADPQAAMEEGPALAAMVRMLGEHQPRLMIPESTRVFLEDGDAETLHPSEVPVLATSTRVAANPRLGAGLEPLPEVQRPEEPTTSRSSAKAGAPAPRLPRPDTGEVPVDPMAKRKKRFAQVSGLSSPVPPPSLLPHFGPELRFGSHRRGELIKRFRGALEAVTMGRLDATTIPLIGLGMLLVPGIYLAILVGLSFNIYRLASERGTQLMDAVVNASLEAGAFSFVLSILLCIYLIFVLLSLAFPGRSRSRYSLFLKRNQELVLFGFVEHLAKMMKAPPPQRIEVSVEAEINYGMQTREGRKELILTLGLPMVSAMDLDQLTGVLTREMATLAERSELFWLRTVEGIRERLGKIVADCLERQERTARNLETKNERTGLGTVVVGLFSFIFFSLARWLAVFFAKLGDLIGSRSRRLLEEAAAEYERRMVGTAVAESTEGLMDQLKPSYREVIAGIDAPSSGIPRLDHLPAQVVLETLLRPEPIRPPRPGKADAKPPIFQSNPHGNSALPASALFRNFDELGRRVTHEYYRAQGIRGVELLPIQQYLDSLWNAEESRHSLDRYFAGMITSRRPVPVAPQLVSDGRSQQKLLASLMGLRGKFEGALEQYRVTLEDFDVATDCRLGAREAFKLLEADLEHQGMSVDEWKVLERDAIDRLGEIGPALREHETLAGQRLMSALMMLTDPGWGRDLEAADLWRREVPHLLTAVTLINRSFQPLLELRDRYTVLETLKQFGEQSEEDRRLALEIFERQNDSLYPAVATLYNSLGSAVDIFHFGGRDMGLAIRGLPNDYFTASAEILGRIYGLYFRALARLAFMAERIELAAGLGPLPDYGPYPEIRPWGV